MLVQLLQQQGFEAQGAPADLGVGELIGLVGKAVPDVVRLLEDGAPEVREEALTTLGDLGPHAAAAVPVLLVLIMVPSLVGTYQLQLVIYGLIAASDNLSAQSIFYATSQDPLIGEELFAAGAYVGAGASHEASLNVQDILRWLIILAILIGSVLKLGSSL